MRNDDFVESEQGVTPTNVQPAAISPSACFCLWVAQFTRKLTTDAPAVHAEAAGDLALALALRAQGLHLAHLCAGVSQIPDSSFPNTPTQTDNSGHAPPIAWVGLVKEAFMLYPTIIIVALASISWAPVVLVRLVLKALRRN